MSAFCARSQSWGFLRSSYIGLGFAPLRNQLSEYVTTSQKVQAVIPIKPHKTWQDWKALDEKANIMLMGSPGSGKTTTGRIVAHQLGMPSIDVDDDHLEPLWGSSVATKLQQVGDSQFVEEEGRALLQLNVEGTVISLTGSNPLHFKSMMKMAQSGIIIFLDVSQNTILQRLNMMKVDRIVGQKSGATISSILDYRQEFYQQWYDIRVICEDQETPKSIADKVIAAVADFRNETGFVSSRGGYQEGYISFLDTVLKGLAPDGGLYLKASHRPKFSPGELKRLIELEFRERALRILEKWIHPLDMSPQDILNCLYTSYRSSLFGSPVVAPVRKLVDNHYLLELFHGPTASFKDLALQVMPHFFVKAMKKQGDVSKWVSTFDYSQGLNLFTKIEYFTQNQGM